MKAKFFFLLSLISAFGSVSIAKIGSATKFRCSYSTFSGNWDGAFNVELPAGSRAKGEVRFDEKILVKLADGTRQPARLFGKVSLESATVESFPGIDFLELNLVSPLQNTTASLRLQNPHGFQFAPYFIVYITDQFQLEATESSAAKRIGSLFCQPIHPAE